MNRRRTAFASGLLLVAATFVAAPADAARVRDRDRDTNRQLITPDLANVQSILEYNGYLEQGEYRTGEYDDATTEALRHFQREHGLKRTGVVDYETMSILWTHAPLAEPSGGTRQADSDRDGIGDDQDRCPGTIAGAGVDAEGCPDSGTRD